MIRTVGISKNVLTLFSVWLSGILIGRDVGERPINSKNAYAGKGGRNGGREGGREGGTEEGREGGREGGRERG